MKNFLKKQKEILVIFIYAVLIAILIYFVIMPMITRIEAMNNQIQEETVKREMLNRRIENLPKIKQQYETIEKNENSIDVLYEENKAVFLIEKLEKFAEESNNQIEISVQNPQKEGNVSNVKNKKTEENSIESMLPSPDYMQIQILLKGSYNGTVNFISKLEGMEYYSDIIGVKIKQDENRRDSNFGSVSPFSQNTEANQEEVIEINKDKILETTLNVVFYIKK